MTLIFRRRRLMLPGALFLCDFQLSVRERLEDVGIREVHDLLDRHAHGRSNGKRDGCGRDAPLALHSAVQVQREGAREAQARNEEAPEGLVAVPCGGMLEVEE